MKLWNKYKELIFLLIILAIAGFLRLYNIAAYLTFLGDEGRDALVAYNILHGHLTLLGPRASAGDFFTGPIYYYMMAPFFALFNNSPVGPAVMIALLSVATVWLIYYISKKFFGVSGALVAAILYAISPLVITYSRSSWNPNPMPFFTLLLLYWLYLGVKKTAWKWIVSAGFLYGIALQLHYIEVFTGVVIFFFVLCGNSYLVASQKGIKNYLKSFKESIGRDIKQYLQLILGFLIGFSPFIAFEIRHQFENTKAIWKFILVGDPTANDITHNPFWTTISDVFFRLFGHLIYYYPNKEFSYNSTSSYPSGLLILWMAVIVVISLVSVYAIRFIKDKLFAMLLFLWLILGVCLFSFYHKPIYDYYFEFMFVLPFLLYGNLFYVITRIRKSHKVYNSLALIILVCIIAFNFYKTPIQYAPNNQMRQMQEVSDFILSKTNNQPYNFALASKGDSPDAYLYFFHIAHRDPVTIDNLINDPNRTTVTNQLFVVCESQPCQVIANSDFPIAGFGQAQIVGQWQVSVEKIYKLVHYNPGKI